MDCIPYIKDLTIEIDTLEGIKKNGNCDIDKIDEQINQKKELLVKCKNNLSKLSKNNIEYRLYLKILEGKKPSKAIQEIADENYQNDIKPTTPSKIWENYYKKIKKFI